MRYKIESCVAVPEARGRYRKYPFNEMQTGDSFVVARDEVDRLRSSASWYGKRNGLKFAIRCVDPVNGEYRCWRIA